MLHTSGGHVAKGDEVISVLSCFSSNWFAVRERLPSAAGVPGGPKAMVGVSCPPLTSVSGRPARSFPQCSLRLEDPFASGISMDDGPFFEDFRVGAQVRGKVGRTVTETDNVWFTLLTGNSNQIHFNEDYTRRTFPGEPFRGRRVVNGFLTIAIAAGLPVDGTSRNGFQVRLENVRFPRPVFPRDPLYADAQITEVPGAPSRPGCRLFPVPTRGLHRPPDTVIDA